MSFSNIFRLKQLSVRGVVDHRAVIGRTSSGVGLNDNGTIIEDQVLNLSRTADGGGANSIISGADNNNSSKTTLPTVNHRSSASSYSASGDYDDDDDDDELDDATPERDVELKTNVDHKQLATESFKSP